MTAPNQRQMTKLMRAALAAGIERFEIVDPISGGVLFRALPEGQLSGQDDITGEIARWSRGRKA